MAPKALPGWDLGFALGLSLPVAGEAGQWPLFSNVVWAELWK